MEMLNIDQPRHSFIGQDSNGFFEDSVTQRMPPGFNQSFSSGLKRANTDSSAATSQSFGVFGEDSPRLARHSSYSAMDSGFLSHELQDQMEPGMLMRTQSDLGAAPLMRAASLPHSLSNANDLNEYLSQFGSASKAKLKKKTTGPVHNAKYKAKLCKNWVQTGMCPYYEKCQFAHGEQEIQKWAMRRMRLKEKQTFPTLPGYMPTFDGYDMGPMQSPSPNQQYAQLLFEQKQALKAEMMMQMLNEKQAMPGMLQNSHDIVDLLSIRKQQSFDGLNMRDNIYNDMAGIPKLRAQSFHEDFGHNDSSLSLDMHSMNEKWIMAASNPGSKSSQSTFSLLGRDSNEDFLIRGEEKDIAPKEPTKFDIWQSGNQIDMKSSMNDFGIEALGNEFNALQF